MTFRSLWPSARNTSSSTDSTAREEPRIYGTAIIHKVNVTERELRQPPRGTLADLPSLDEASKKSKK